MNVLDQRSHSGRTAVNVSEDQRWIHLLGGVTLMGMGVMSRGAARVGLTLLGGGLVYTGLTGRSSVYRMLNVNTAVKTDSVNVSVPQQQGVHVTKTVTINRSPQELYAFWRNFENLPRIMRHLESVTMLDGNRSHWKAKAPISMTVEWDAEIVNEKPHEVIGWRSLQDAQIPNAGSVRFKPLEYGRGTEVKVELGYVPPAGKLGATVAKLLGEEPEVQIEDDLRRYKQLMEAGEIATTDGQPSGREA
jgi:uncharacterized membrane protein